MTNWIPMDECWPEIGQEVLIYTQYNRYKIGSFMLDDSHEDGGYGFEGDTWDDYTDAGEVLAWQKLPEPYKEKTELQKMYEEKLMPIGNANLHRRREQNDI